MKLYTVMQIARTFLSIGYDVCFVVALVTTVRVTYIFKNVSPTKKVFMYQGLCFIYLVNGNSILLLPGNTEGEGLAAFATHFWHCHDRSPLHHSAPHTDLCEGRFWAGKG